MHSMRAYRSGSRALQLIRGDRGDGGAPTALVRDPVQRVFGCVLTVAPQTAPATEADTSNEQRSLQGLRITASPSTLQVNYRNHNSPPTGPTLSHINPVHDLPTHLSNNNFNTIFPSTSMPSKWSLPSGFLHQNPLCLPLLPHTCRTPSPSHRSWPNCPRNICCAAHNVKPCSPPPHTSLCTPSPSMQQAKCHTSTQNKGKQNVLRRSLSSGI
jgi:hypothetical protein